MYVKINMQKYIIIFSVSLPRIFDFICFSFYNNRWTIKGKDCVTREEYIFEAVRV